MTEDFLAARTRATPNAPSLIYAGRTWIYSQLNGEVAAICARLAAAGVRPGDRVGVLLGNVPAFVFLVHALIRMRAVIVPLNLRLTPVELAGLVEQSGLAGLVHDAETAGTVSGLLPEERLIPVERLIEPDEGVPAEWPAGEVDPNADWGILFTSGTTGSPRGAVIPLRAVQAASAASAKRLGTGPGDRWLLAMPLYHIGGLAIVIRSCLDGSAIVLQDGFDPEAVWTALDRDRVTLISLVPTMLRRLLEYAPGRSVPDVLRLVLVGGAAAAEELVSEALDRGWPVALTYGLTEAVSQVATALPAAVRRKRGSVGKALFGIRLRIAEPDAHGGPGRPLPPGAPGEIFVSGPTLMRGYLGEKPVGEWFATGDIGCLDEDGDLYLLDRRTDLIVSGGENVYPAEIERVLQTHPGIREACVVGIEDAEWGRRVAAAVVLEDRSLTVKDIETYLRPRIAGYKLPREILLLDELPCTASGKVCRPDVVKLFFRDQGA